MSERVAIERWMARLRLVAVLFVLLQVSVFTSHFPPGYESAAWEVTAIFAAGAVAYFLIAQFARPEWVAAVGLSALVFDTVVIGAYAIVFSYGYGNQTRWAMILVVAEAALRYGIVGGIVLPLALIPYFWFNERWRGEHFGPPGFIASRVPFPAGVLLVTGVIVGWLVRRLHIEAQVSSERAAESERLRDALGRRVDILEAANRCARALASSLQMEHALGAFIGVLRLFVPFERTAIVLIEDDSARTVATAGRGADEVFPAGSVVPLRGSALERVLDGQIVVRPDLAAAEHPEDERLADLGLRSELVAPLLLGTRSIGMLTLSRDRVDAFGDEDIELVSLLGRLVATAVQNIRAYEAERRTVEELRRLSALRADFVSLVSHELRSPMAAVIGAARTLQKRWRALTVSQRESFLALIADETNRLAALIGDVLDTSRIEAGTFSYSFTDVDLGRLVQDAVATAEVGQEEVRLRATVADALPPIRGDRDRLRQVLMNLIDNAVKYSPDGDEVEVSARQAHGTVRISVTDRGPGIPRDQQGLIFEKFGRASVSGGSKPGTGLGLFIARSIVEAHGGSLDVSSRPEAGATFILTLPCP